MEKDKVVVGGHYVIAHGGSHAVIVRVDRVRYVENYHNRATVRVDCTKLSTGRTITLKSFVKLRYPVVKSPSGTWVRPQPDGTAVRDDVRS